MTPEAILKEPARILTQTQREHYFEKGFVSGESLVPLEMLQTLISVTEAFVDQSRRVQQSGKIFEIGPGH